ncbi:MAG: 50S ribosomal protein L11 methyltransferase [Anaerolineales bacterium]
MKWFEVRLTVNGELAEPVAELLSRHCDGGVVITSETEYGSQVDLNGPVTIAGYFPAEHAQGKRRKIEEGLWHLSQIQQLPQPTFRAIEEENWAESWREHYQPINVGQRLRISPSWHNENKTDRLTIKIDPGMAFGTGTHPTTILCLELLERYLNPGDEVIDLGCGTGILSIASLKLGADRVLAYDVDPAAVKATGENARHNGVEASIVVQEGTLAEAKEAVRTGAPADLVTANILATVLTSMLADGLAELVAGKSVLILSGILEEQAGEVEAAAEEHNLKLVQLLQKQDWVALAFKKNPAPREGAGYQSSLDQVKS